MMTAMTREQRVLALTIAQQMSDDDLATIVADGLDAWTEGLALLGYEVTTDSLEWLNTMVRGEVIHREDSRRVNDLMRQLGV